MYNLLQLNSMKVAELKEVADKLAIDNADKLKKQDLIYKILDVQALKAEPSASEPASESAPTSEASADQPLKGKRDRARKPAKGVEPAGDMFQETSSAENSPDANAETTDSADSKEPLQPQQGQPRQLQGPNQGDRRQQGQRDQRSVPIRQSVVRPMNMDTISMASYWPKVCLKSCLMASALCVRRTLTT